MRLQQGLLSSQCMFTEAYELSFGVLQLHAS